MVSVCLIVFRNRMINVLKTGVLLLLTAVLFGNLEAQNYRDKIWINSSGKYIYLENAVVRDPAYYGNYLNFTSAVEDPLRKEIEYLLETGVKIYREKRYAEAEKLLDSALKLCKKQKDLELTARVYDRLGWATFENNKIEKAINIAKEVFKYDVNEIGYKAYAQSYFAIGRYYLRSSDSKNAEKYLLSALELYKKIQDIIGISNSYVELGFAYHNLAQTEKALQCAKKAVELSKQCKDTLYLGKSYQVLGMVNNQTGNYELSLEYFNISNKLFKTINDSLRIAYTFEGMGCNYLNQEKSEQAIPYYKKALNIGLLINDNTLIARDYNMLAFCYKATDNFNKAIEYSNLSEKYYKKCTINDNYKRDLGHLYVFKMQLYSDKAEYQKALFYGQKAEQLFINTNQFFHLDFLYSQLIQLCYDIEDYENAFLYTRKAYNINIKIKSSSRLPLSEIDVGFAYLNCKKDTNQAIKWFYNAAKHSKEQNDSFNIMYSLGAISELESAVKKSKTSISKINQAIKLCIDNKFDNLQYFRLLKTKGNIYKNLGKYDSAALMYDSARNYYDIRRDIEDLNKIYKLMAEAYELGGRYDKAYFALKKHMDYQDSLKMKEAKRTLSELMVKHKTKEKETENELLKKENKIKELTISREQDLRSRTIIFSSAAGALLLGGLLMFAYFYRQKSRILKELEQNKRQLEQINSDLKTSEEQLAASNKVKDKLFSIISHDLRSPIDTFAKMTGLLAGNFDDIAPENKKKYLKEMYSHSTAVSGQLNKLLLWAKLHLHNIEAVPEEIELNAIVQENIDYLSPFAGEKGMEIHFENTVPVKAFADSSMVSIIVKNLIENSIKHSKNADIITVNVLKDNGFSRLEVSDNGTLDNKEMVTDMFNMSKRIFAPNKFSLMDSGLGVSISKEFTEMNGGEISAEAMEGGGLKVSVLLPEKRYIPQIPL